MALARFTLRGTRYELSRELVESRLHGVAPAAIREHAVEVNGVWYPVKQAFEVAVGVPRSEFISHAARRHLATLGFPLRGEIDSRDATSGTTAVLPPTKHEVTPVVAGSEWHTETNVQAAVVTLWRRVDTASCQWPTRPQRNTASM